ncbi:MAG: hypothetical protein K2H60_08825, partial [Muribaculaceae bacterium]|nr:hypothetical protein [Muribaculaceae bacterium]
MVRNLLLGGAMLLATSAMAQDAPEALYVVGAFTNWVTPDNGGGLPLYDLTGDGTYTGSFDVEKDQASFKIFTSREGNWNDQSTYFGCEYGLDNFVWSDKPLTLTCNYDTQTNIQIPFWEGGPMQVMVTNLGEDNWRVTIKGPDQPEYPGFDPIAHLYMSFNTPDSPPDEYLSTRPMTRTGFQTFEDNFYFSGNGESPLMVNFWSGLLAPRNYGPENADDTLNPELGVVQTFKGVPDCDNFWKTAENWSGGRMKVTADLNTMEFTFEEVEDYIYLIGSPQGWDINSDAMTLPETGDMGHYEATFTMTEDSPIFRFYNQLGDWETGSWGSQVNDEPVELPLDGAETTTDWV